MKSSVTFFTLVSLLTLVVLFMSCSDNDDCPTCPEESGNLFTVTVVDTLGNPVEGLRVGRINQTYHSPILDKAQDPDAGNLYWLAFSPFEGYVSFKIYDYYNNLLVDVYDSGSVDYRTAVQIAWAPLDSLGTRFRDGFYYGYYKFTSAAEPDSVVEIIDPNVLEPTPDPAYSANFLGYTDVNGIYYSSDTLYFPCLLGNQPTTYVKDGAGRPLDSLILYTDTVTITLSDTASPTVFMLSNQVLTAGKNHFEIVWDPRLAE